MRTPPDWRRSIRTAMLVGMVLALAAPGLLACSGPGAMRLMEHNHRIGRMSAGISAAIVVLGSLWSLAIHRRGRWRWMVASLAFHPSWWISAYRGDCGFGLLYWSTIAPVEIALISAAVLCWPPRPDAKSGGRLGMLSGLLVGTGFGLALDSVAFGGPQVNSPERLIILATVPLGAALAGAIVGRGLALRRAQPGSRWTTRTSTLLLIPIALAPLMAALLPVVPYRASTSVSRPFHFLVVEDGTGRPIPGAIVQVIDPRYPRDDRDNQGMRVTAEPDGKAGYYIFANVYGREGFLGRTETITYDPLTVTVEAPGYRPFSAALGEGLTPAPERSNDPPMGLAFPPPPSATIRMKPGP